MSMFQLQKKKRKKETWKVQKNEKRIKRKEER